MISNWPLSPLTLRTFSIQREQRLPKDFKESSYFLDSVERANHLFNWLYDAQESLFLQVGLYREKNNAPLKRALQITVVLDQPKDESLWTKDCTELLSIRPSKEPWSKGFWKENWKHAFLLERKGSQPSNHPSSDSQSLLELLSQKQEPILIQHNFYLHWHQANSSSLKMERMPDEIYSDPRRRQHWLRVQKQKLEEAKSPKRIIRHRACMYSDSIPSPLLKHSSFRAMMGYSPLQGIWHRNYSCIEHASHPVRLFQERISFKDTSSPQEMHSYLSSNHNNNTRELEIHSFDDDLPF